LQQYIDTMAPLNVDDLYGTVMARKRMVHQLLCSFYTQATPQPSVNLSEVLDRVCSTMMPHKGQSHCEKPQQKATAAKPEVVFVVTNKVGKEHHLVRSQAYPYDVRHLGGADGDVEQDMVVEARCKGDNQGCGELLGFINMRRDNYIIDLAVAPAAQGMGLGARLIREAARQCLARLDLENDDKEPDKNSEARQESPRIKLHVRLYNLQARALYLKLGFKETERCFPGWYDWHGGVSMEISIDKLLNASASPLPSQIHSMGFLNKKSQKNSTDSHIHASKPKVVPKIVKPDIALKGAPQAASKGASQGAPKKKAQNRP